MLSPEAANHFLVSFIRYLDTMILEAEFRISERTLTEEEYWVIRIDNGAVQPLILLGELHNPLPDDVVYHPLVVELAKIVCQLVCLDNVSTSLTKRELARFTNLGLVPGYHLLQSREDVRCQHPQSCRRSDETTPARPRRCCGVALASMPRPRSTLPRPSSANPLVGLDARNSPRTQRIPGAHGQCPYGELVLEL